MVVPDESLPPEIAGVIAALPPLSDKALWKVARTSRLPAKTITKIENLHHKRQMGGLNEEEQRLLAQLIIEYDKALVVLSIARGGQTVEQNLWLACSTCNDTKNDRIEATDLYTNMVVPLFNPRVEVWSEHFVWVENGVIMLGRTSTGRATIEALNLNRSLLIKARKKWVEVG